MKYFESQQISDRVTRITSIAGEYMYLINGDTKAALIDTGVGLGNLNSFVRTLTTLPIVVLLTHGHVDHIGGASLFDEVFLSSKDRDLYQVHIQFDIRGSYLDSMNIKYNVDDFSPIRAIVFEELNNKQILDLGGINLQILECSGHTQGSVMIIIQEERAVIFGDDCNNFTFLFDDYCPTISEYCDNLEKIKKFENQWDKVYLFHGTGDAPKAVLDDVIELCQDIIEHKADNNILSIMGKELHIGKAINSDISRVDGRFGNIIYDINRIK